MKRKRNTIFFLIILFLIICIGFLIQKYYPELIRYLAPVDTPMEAHAKMMRKAYGEDIRVVIVGPCIACHKLAAITQNGKLIDAYLNFEELERWMESENLKITRE